MDISLIYNILKYTAQGTVIYLLFRYLAKTNLKDYETLLITCIILLSCALLENLFAKRTPPVENKLQSIADESCGTCSTEPFEGSEEEAQEETQEETQEEAQEDTQEETQEEAQEETQEVPKQKKCLVWEGEEGVESDNKLRAKEGEIYDHVIRDAAKQRRGTRYEKGVIADEYKYTDYGLVPVADGYKSRDYEYGYSFMPPEKWYPQPPRPPVCVSEKRCPVCPVSTTGAPVDMKEFNSSRRVTPPSLMDVDYVEEKFNSGR